MTLKNNAHSDCQFAIRLQHTKNVQNKKTILTKQWAEYISEFFHYLKSIERIDM